MKNFKVGVDSYSVKWLNLSPMELLIWAKKNGADGVHFTERNLKPGQKIDKAFLKKLAQQATDLELFLEWGGGQHIPFNCETWQPVNLTQINRSAAEQANVLETRIIRSCSGGLMRWKKNSPATETLIREMAQALKPQRSMFEDLNVCLAIELHFEFTTFELLKLFELCDAEPGGYLGICLDTMNVLTMLEDPVAATERILPWVVATHAKDGGIFLDDQGLATFTAEAGTGVVDWQKILDRLNTLDRDVTLSVEDHGGTCEIPIFDPTFISKFPDVTTLELSKLLHLANKTKKLVEAGKLAPVDRNEWQKICEPRIKNGIKNIKSIVRNWENSRSD